MKELAQGVWQLDGTPGNGVNVYVVGDVLIDAGMVYDKGRVLKQIEGRGITAHTLTHAHLDHYGPSAAICDELGIPLWCGAEDVPKGHPVARALREGDTVAGFEVLDTPGHSPGHVSYWREADRVLICGDVMWGWNPFLLRGPIREPFGIVTPDVERNRESARRIAALQPALVCFGHGPPLRDPNKLTAAVAKLAR